jgi:hypothetical protein
MEGNFLIKEAMEGKDEFSRQLARARFSLENLGFQNMTNKELLVLSHYVRSFLSDKSLEDRGKEAVDSCFFHITGYFPDQIGDPRIPGAKFSAQQIEYIQRLRKKYAENNTE